VNGQKQKICLKLYPAALRVTVVLFPFGAKQKKKNKNEKDW
jgi:hypothetical protein